MTPYYDEGGITIYHGDCRDVVVPYDVVVTDPPYGNGTDYGVYNDSPESLRALVGWLGPRLARSGGAVTPGVRNLWMYPRPTWVLCWYSPAGAGRSSWGFSTWQPVLVYGNDPFLATGRGCRPDSYAGRQLGGREVERQNAGIDHPCPKPPTFMRWMVDRTTLPGAVILDPFMGSGSTLRAAKDLGRRAIGIEIEERYCEIAARRLGQEVLAL